jgi:hypothetical protein
MALKIQKQVDTVEEEINSKLASLGLEIEFDEDFLNEEENTNDNKKNEKEEESK